MNPLPFVVVSNRAFSGLDGTYHNVVRQALSQIPISAVTPESYGPKEHLDPTENWIGFPKYTVSLYSPRTNRLFMYMELKVDTQE